MPVACGGGGIPVVRRGGRLHGVDAVIDKDRASAVLAAELGAERLLILTDVTAVKRGFGTPAEEELRELTAEQAEELLPDLAEGSMRPKVEAAISVARDGRRDDHHLARRRRGGPTRRGWHEDRAVTSPVTTYAPSEGGYVAYQLFGSGSTNLVFVTSWASNST